MMPEPCHQHDHFVQSVRDNDVTGIINAFSNDVFDLNYRDVTHDLETPLMRLCHSGISDDNMDAILNSAAKKVPDVKLQDAVGRTLTMHACIALRHQIVVFSLAHGCDVSLCDRMGRSAYHYAAESGSDWIMATLLKQPDALTCLKVLDFKGYSPTDIARHRKAHSVVKMISQAMSGNTTDSNSRPLNPKPLQPAFMRSTNNNQTPNKKQVTFDKSLESNISINPGYRSVVDNLKISKKGNTLNKLPRSKGEDDNTMAKYDNKRNVFSNNNSDNDEDNGNDHDDNGSDNYNDYNNNDHDDAVDSSNGKEKLTTSELSPLRDTSHKHGSDKLECFTSNTPMGLIKPRPLPRLLTNHNKDSPTPRDDYTAMDTTNNTPEPIQHDTPRKPNSKMTSNNNNVFTLRPPPSNHAQTNRPLTLPTEGTRATNSSPKSNSEPKPSPRDLKGSSTNNSPKSIQRNKISLDLSFGAGGVTTSRGSSPIAASPRQLGPVASPRKKPNKNGRTAVDALLSNSANQYNHLKSKFSSKEVEKVDTQIGNEPTNKDTGSDVINRDINNATQTTQQQQQQQQQQCQQQPDDAGRVTTSRRQLPCRISTAGRRDLEAILSPVVSHRPLLQKRKPTDSIRSQCDNIRNNNNNNNNSEAINNSGFVVTAGKDNLFEEEIFLNAENGSIKLGGKRTDENIEAMRRSGSRMTIRRSSLSLPDLRDMTGCLVMTQKASRTTGQGSREAMVAGGKEEGNGKMKTGMNKDDDDGDTDEYGDDKGVDDGDDDDDDDVGKEDDYDDDNAVMDGDKSDDNELNYDNDDYDCGISCEAADNIIDRKVKTPTANRLHSNKNNNNNNRNPRRVKGSNSEIPLPSIQVTNDSKSSFPSKSRGLAVPWS